MTFSKKTGHDWFGRTWFLHKYILVVAKIMVWALDQFLELRNASDYMCLGLIASWVKWLTTSDTALRTWRLTLSGFRVCPSSPTRSCPPSPWSTSYRLRRGQYSASGGLRARSWYWRYSSRLYWMFYLLIQVKVMTSNDREIQVTEDDLSNSDH